MTTQSEQRISVHSDMLVAQFSVRGSLGNLLPPAGSVKQRHLVAKRSIAAAGLHGQFKYTHYSIF